MQGGQRAGLTGTYERQLPDGWQTNRYNYQVVRLWQEDPEPYLTAQVYLVPLAPLTNVPESEEALRGLVRRMAERINAEPQPRAAKLWTATCLLMGVRFSEELAFQLLEGVQNMRESTTYQAILRAGRQEGKVEGEQELLLRQGTKRFGEPDAATIAPLEAIQDIDRLGRSANGFLTRTSKIGTTCYGPLDPRRCRVDLQGLRTTFSCVFEGFSRELCSHYIIQTNCTALYSSINYRNVTNMRSKSLGLTRRQGFPVILSSLL